MKAILITIVIITVVSILGSDVLIAVMNALGLLTGNVLG